MPDPETDPSAVTEALAMQARAGDSVALESLWHRVIPTLARMVGLRLDRRLLSRMDPSDVASEVLLDASKRLSDWAGTDTIPFRVWIRFLARQKVLEMHRRHFDAGSRDVRREQQESPESSDPAVAALADSMTSPSSHAARREELEAVQRAIGSLDPDDREILLMRHVEQLPNRDVAQELGIDPKLASKRHLRALEKVKRLLGGDRRGP